MSEREEAHPSGQCGLILFIFFWGGVSLKEFLKRSKYHLEHDKKVLI